MELLFFFIFFFLKTAKKNMGDLGGLKTRCMMSFYRIGPSWLRACLDHLNSVKKKKIFCFPLSPPKKSAFYRVL